MLGRRTLLGLCLFLGAEPSGVDVVTFRSPSDQIELEVVFRLAGEVGAADGFQRRNDARGPAR